MGESTESKSDPIELVAEDPVTGETGDAPVPKRGRGRSRRLDREKIVAAALEVSRNDGPERLSMRRVAARLGVDPAALYWHFRNKDELLGSVNRASAEAADLAVPADGAWQNRCLALCQAMRRELRERPELALRGGGSLWATPFNARANGLMVELLAGAGLPAPDLIFASFALLHEVNAISGSEALNRGATRDSLRAFVREVEARLPPETAEAWREVCRIDTDQSFDRTFEFAIRALIVGIDDKIAAAAYVPTR
jgi:TetR/AcrR family tetracycline transcriptional repressor